MDKKHAGRREQAERIHRRARRRLRERAQPSMLVGDLAEIGRRTRTPKPCSCWMCVNARRHAKGKERLTAQERRVTDSQKEPLE